MSDVVDLGAEKRRRVSPLAVELPPPDELSAADESTERLVAMTRTTNLVALDKTLSAIKLCPSSSWTFAAARCSSIAERLVRACREVGICLPLEWRTECRGARDYVQGKD